MSNKINLTITKKELPLLLSAVILLKLTENHEMYDVKEKLIKKIFKITKDI